MKRKIVLFLSLIMIICACPSFWVSANNGSCGTSAVWNFDAEDGTLYISGTGAMTDYSSDSEVPWHHHNEDIVKVAVSEGITHVGNNAFRRLEELLSVKLPKSLVSIGDKSFAYCYTLREISIPTGVESIGESAFYYCKSITDVTVPDAVTVIEKDCFFGCQALIGVKMGDGVKSIEAGAFYFCLNLSNLRLSQTLESIGEKAFGYCESLKVFTCTMSGTAWASVEIASGNEYLTGARRYDGTAIPGDVDSDETLGANDAIYLLYHVFFGSESYPIGQSCDFNNDGGIDADDAIYLLYHVFFGSESYPL